MLIHMRTPAASGADYFHSYHSRCSAQGIPDCRAPPAPRAAVLRLSVLACSRYPDTANPDRHSACLLHVLLRWRLCEHLGMWRSLDSCVKRSVRKEVGVWPAS